MRPARHYGVRADSKVQPQLSEPNQPTEPYSKAFETFVRDPEDIVGFLAYALFKESIRERVRAGQAVPPYLRDPTKPDAAAYRGRAERALELYAEKAIDDATPAIVAGAQSGAKGEIIAEIRSSTGLWANITTGVVVWLVTIILTVVVVSGAPSWVRGLVEHVAPK
jgi:hypothetical protein